MHIQVGTIYETIGNGSDAENFLKWGKEISCQQNLSLFIIAFSSVLGITSSFLVPVFVHNLLFGLNDLVIS